MGHRGFRFGEWQIDPDSNTLSDGTANTQLEPRAMDVLRYLCRHPGAVIPVEELLQSCWGSVEFGDNPVHKAITQLRRALGDSSSEPRYIETIRKRGYRAIAEVVAPDALDDGSWLQGSPFRGLEAFQENHAAIFFGRMQATARLRDVVQQQAAAGCALTLVLGPSGSGKTSLVRAGLLPALAAAPAGSPAADPAAPVALACSVHMDCADLGGGNLFQALAAALIDAELDNVHLFTGDSADALGRRLENDAAAVAAQLRASAGQPRIALFVDRLEAIFRAPGVTDEGRVHFIGVLEQLARCGAVLVLLACRNDFYPDIMALPPLLALKTRGGHVDVSPPEGADIAQIVRQPARAASLSFERDAASGASLDDVLCDAARGSPDTLPLLQYCLNELYRQRSDTGELRFAVFQQLGGIEGAVAVRAEQVVAALTQAQTAALPHVLSLLVDVAEEQGAVTARRAAWASLRNKEERELVRLLVEARLFVSELSGDVPSFGVAHEALLRRWPRVADWIERHRHALQVRTRLSQQAERWIVAGRPRDLLLPAGIQVNQARGLLGMKGFSLSAHEHDYVRSSLHRVKLGERLRLAVIGLVAGLAVLAGVLGLTARSAQRDAEQHRTEAEGLMGYMLGDFVEKLRPLGRLDLLDGVSAKALTYLSSTDSTDSAPVALAQRAKALQVIAEVNIARAKPEAATEALLAARIILQRQLAASSSDAQLLKDLGANAFWLGQIHLNRRDWSTAQQYFTEYRDFSNRIAANDPDDVDGWIEQSYAHSSLGTVALRRGDPAQAATNFQTSLELKQRAFAKQPANRKLQADIANSLSWLADAQAKLGQLSNAMKLLRQEEEMLRPLHLATPGDALWTFRLANALWHQGELNSALGQQASARTQLRLAEELFQSINKQDPSNRSWQLSLYTVQLKMLEADSEERPLPVLAKQHVLHEQLFALSGLEPTRATLPLLLAKAKLSLAATYARLHRGTEAKAILQAGLKPVKRLHDGNRNDPQLSTLYANLLLMRAELDGVDGNSAAAQEACSQAQAILAIPAQGSSDFRILAPQIRAHLCTGDAALVSQQVDKLERMAYRDAQYVKYLSSHPPKKGTL